MFLRGRQSYIEVWYPVEFSTLNHSSFDNFPSPSLSAFTNIFLIWEKYFVNNKLPPSSIHFCYWMLWNHQSKPIMGACKHLLLCSWWQLFFFSNHFQIQNILIGKTTKRKLRKRKIKFLHIKTKKKKMWLICAKTLNDVYVLYFTLSFDKIPRQTLLPPSSFSPLLL